MLGGYYDADGSTNGNGAPRKVDHLIILRRNNTDMRDGGMDEQTGLRCARWVMP